MSVQNVYGYATEKGIAGGIYDMYHYPVDSRVNEEASGVLRCGVGVVRGTIAGTDVKLPTADATAAAFEGVVVNGFTNQEDLEGRTHIMKNQTVGVMKKGRIWVVLGANRNPHYGERVHMLTEGDDAGCFAAADGIELEGRFLGGAEQGLAPVELYGIDA